MQYKENVYNMNNINDHSNKFTAQIIANYYLKFTLKKKYYDFQWVILSIIID